MARDSPHPNTEARERALELLYEAETKDVHPADVVAGLPVPPAPYAVELAVGVGDHVELLDHVVAARARGWSTERMAALDRQVLRLGAYELLFRPDQPEGVVADEVVRLAKRFSTDGSGRFVNGLLAAVIPDLRGDDAPWAGAAEPAGVVLDVDGVLRHWDVGELASAESSLGLPAGSLAAVAFEPALMHRVLTGAITDEAWRLEVGGAAADAHGVEAAAVAALWAGVGWSIDAHVVDLLAEVRAAGLVRRTALFSNATDRLEVDLETAKLHDATDVVVNSARLGLAKPDADAYLAMAEQVGLPPGQLLFVDDRPENVRGAIAAGVPAVRFTGAPRLRAVLVRVGALPA